MDLGHLPVANSSRITRCDLVSHQLVRVWRWIEDCGRLKNFALVGQPSGAAVRWGLRVEQSLQRGGSNPGHHGASAIELPEKAVQIWRCNARRGMAPRGDRLLEREKL